MHNLVSVDTFKSISGEVSPFPQGKLCGFIRFQSCNLKDAEACPYCDTRNNSFPEIPIQELWKWAFDTQKQTGLLCITGGEPLLYQESIDTLFSIIDPMKTFIETNGTIDFRKYINVTNLVVDYKLHMNYIVIPSQYFDLGKNDYIKFVITSNESLQTAIEVQKKIEHKNKGVKFAYSPVFNEKWTWNATQIKVRQLYDTLVYNQVQASINVQLHKLLNFN